MEEIFKFLIEFVVTFIVIYLIYYFVIIRKNKTYDPNYVPVEVNFILLKHKIDIKTINYRKMLIWISLVTSFNMSLFATIIFRLVENVYLGILISLLIIVPLSLIGYNFIGRHFEKNNDKK